MKTVFITGTNRRHIAFLEALTPVFPPALIVMEGKKPRPPAVTDVLKDFSRIFREEEQRCFGEKSEQSHDAHICNPGMLNSPEIIQMVRDVSPEMILVFGSGLLSSEMLSLASKYCLNIHTAITQCFRGVDSPLWAIHDREPEGIGATIHLVAPNIDAGDIVLQGRPNLDPDDTIHGMFFKSVKLGFKLMKESVEGLTSGQLSPLPIPKRGKLYQVKDFSEEVVIRANERKQEVIKCYLRNKTERDSLSPIIHY